MGRRCGSSRLRRRVHHEAPQPGHRHGRVTASVRPEQIPVSDPLANVRGASSIAHFEIDTLPSGLTLVSHDPGPDTTAYDMLADFVNAVKAR